METLNYGWTQRSSIELFRLKYFSGILAKNCTAVFGKNSVKIFKSKEFNTTALCPPIIQGLHNAPSQPLYSVSLPTQPPPIHKANATINVLSIQDRMISTMTSYSLQQFHPGAKQLKMVFFNLVLN